MRCQNCGQKNFITINQKRYCANCGVKHSNAKSSKLAAKPKQAASDSLVLDLTAADKASPRHRPAQSIHGVRRTHGPRRSHPKPHHSPHPEVSRTTAADRLSRSAHIHRHARISKFKTGSSQAPSINQAESEATPTQMAPRRSYHLPGPTRQQLIAAAMAKHHPRTPHVEPAHHPTAKAKKSKRPRLFKRAAHAFKHRPRLATAAAAGLVVLILAVYVTYLNFPNIAVKMAASRAGVDAQMPGYVPAGYGFSGPITYSSGQLTIRFNSRSDDNYLLVTQKKSDWDPATLLEAYVLTRSKNYLTFQENGLTIYVYNGNNAAWINNGIVYTIEGNTRLSSEQVLKMASSL
ncbi:DUF4367 domain-containing protein [Candidatus Microgenomates bacterium]|nr:DUF4367 domain-containing protein [Candidatus Microgenomates bacterium]